ncbi:required for drug-induced death protein 1 [Dunckerocampus dactyliophorus]|uniref:required for drug-induced death protein 1 n=1 Tax=Dunckerocampus dactyliophorus TaxID=161453 RepID=UPI002405480C|nr:required for drug-induced death protein 1 [Dunckerocampus dactyliophorus]
MATKETLQKTSKEVYFRVLPDKYEPLIEDEGIDETSEERLRRKEKRKRKRKKYRRNLKKACSFTWRCLVSGLQSLAASYAMPLSTVAVVMENQRAMSSKA